MECNSYKTVLLHGNDKCYTTYINHILCCVEMRSRTFISLSQNLLGLTNVVLMVFFYRWMRLLNQYGVCLLTDVPAELGQLKKVSETALDLLLQELPSKLLHSNFRVTEMMRSKL